MPRKSSPSLWQTVSIAERPFQLLNLDHPALAPQIFSDMDAGIAVYYDRRWHVTSQLCEFLLRQPQWVAGQRVFVLGAGVGLESVVIGSLCQTLYINDLAPAALDLCAQQLRHNGIEHFICCPGRYETLPLPEVDVIVGCYLVYSRDTAASMRLFLRQATAPVLLANDNLLNWQQFLRETPGPREQLWQVDELTCFLFAASPQP